MPDAGSYVKLSDLNKEYRFSTPRVAQGSILTTNSTPIQRVRIGENDNAIALASDQHCLFVASNTSNNHRLNVKACAEGNSTDVMVTDDAPACKA